MTHIWLLTAAGASPAQPDLAMVDGNGVIFREDFDSSEEFDTQLWQVFVGYFVVLAGFKSLNEIFSGKFQDNFA